MHCSWRQGEFEISTDSSKVDLALVHEFLTNSYWAKGIPLETVTRSIENSLCFGIYEGAGRQVGFARVVSDRATFAYLADVFIMEDHRGKGRLLEVPHAYFPNAAEGEAVAVAREGPDIQQISGNG